MTEDRNERIIALLNKVLEFELAGVVRYTHYSLMVSGPNRIPIVDFMRAQATESLDHATRAGEILTGLGGHPSLSIAPMNESHEHTTRKIIEESLEHELTAVGLYKRLLDEVQDHSIYLEEYARGMVSSEEEHTLELRKMLRDLDDQV